LGTCAAVFFKSCTLGSVMNVGSGDFITFGKSVSDFIDSFAQAHNLFTWI
jgi:hypothetical protein